MTILSGANTYSGGTFLNAGVLAVTSDGNLGTGRLTFNGGTFEALSAARGILSAKPVTIGTSSTLNGSISGAGSLTKAGPGEPSDLLQASACSPDNRSFIP